MSRIQGTFGLTLIFADWDCLESIPRQIGWCSLPHWLEADWYPDYRWPPDIGAFDTKTPSLQTRPSNNGVEQPFSVQKPL